MNTGSEQRQAQTKLSYNTATQLRPCAEVPQMFSYSGGLLCRLIIRDIGMQVAPFSALVEWGIVTNLTS